MGYAIKTIFMLRRGDCIKGRNTTTKTPDCFLLLLFLSLWCFLFNCWQQKSFLYHHFVAESLSELYDTMDMRLNKNLK